MSTKKITNPSMLYAKSVIEKIFSNASVPQEFILESLKELRGNIQYKIDSLEAYLKRSINQ